jgi:hypothetical protein
VRDRSFYSLPLERHQGHAETGGHQAEHRHEVGAAVQVHRDTGQVSTRTETSSGGMDRAGAVKNGTWGR